MEREERVDLFSSLFDEEQVQVQNQPQNQLQNQPQNQLSTSKRRSNIELILNNPRSIVMVNPPKGIVRRINAINSFFKRVPGLLLSGRINSDKLTVLRKKCLELSREAWNSLATVYPIAFSINIIDWNYLNDSHKEKQMIYNQYRERCFVALPITDEVATLYMVVKHMCVVRRKLRDTMDLKIAEVLRETGDKLRAGLDELLDEINKI
ncbi:MAG: hypothetical protein ACP5HC_02155 [Caldisericum sp.]